RDHLVRVHVRRRPRAGLEDVDRELVVELAVRDPICRLRDPLRLLGVEQAELRVHARGRRFDPAEPACDVNRDRLARHGEVVDRLAGLPAPELGHTTESSERAFASSSSQLVSFTRGRPRGAPRPRSCSSIACHPAYSTKSTPRSRSRSSSSPPSPARRPAAASSSTASTVSAASFLFVPITPLGPRLIQPDV